MRLGRGSIRAAWHVRHLLFASLAAPCHLDTAFSFPTVRSSRLAGFLAPPLATFPHLGRPDERTGAPFTATGSCCLDGASRFRRSPPVAQRCTAGKQAWRCAPLSLPAAAAAARLSALLLLFLLRRRSIPCRRVGACARTRTCAHARRGKFPAPGLLLLLVIPTPLTSEVTFSCRSSGGYRSRKKGGRASEPPPSSPRAPGQGCLLRSPFVGCAPRALCSSGSPWAHSVVPSRSVIRAANERIFLRWRRAAAHVVTKTASGRLS